MVEAAIDTARHEACGLSYNQHGLLLEQFASLYEAAAWIKAQQNTASFPLRVWARSSKRSNL